MKHAATPEALESRAVKTIRAVFQSGRPLTYIRSTEEQRVGKLLREAGRSLAGSASLPVWTWSLTEGMRNEEGVMSSTQNPRAALDFIVAQKDPAIFHLKDFHEPLRESAEVRRRLRDLCESCFGQQKFTVITSPVRSIPDEIERSIVVLELLPPDPIELMEFLREEVNQISSQGVGVDVSEANLNPLVRALQGLTLDEARHALRRALAASPGLGPQSLPALLEEKRLLVSRSGIIELIPNTVGLEELGGLAGMKKWLLERRKLFDLRDTLASDIVPKGVLVMGIPGCGKSQSIKAISSCFELPLYRIDMIEIFSGRHGKPEGVFVETCRTLEEMAPAVVWFDEIEMGITAAVSGGEQGRIFAFFLTWMQEKARGLFVGATANRIDLLPAEMIRKGRFDEVFFVDLPLDDEKIEIFEVHLGRRGLEPGRFDLEQMLAFTKGWTGAEIEQCVRSAETAARGAGREMTQEDLIDAAMNTIPLSRSMKEQISHIREWAAQRARRASRAGG